MQTPDGSAFQIKVPQAGEVGNAAQNRALPSSAEAENSNVPRGTFLDFAASFAMFHVEHSRRCGNDGLQSAQPYLLQSNALLSALHKNPSLQIDDGSNYSANISGFSQT